MYKWVIKNYILLDKHSCCNGLKMLKQADDKIMQSSGRKFVSVVIGNLDPQRVAESSL